MARGRKKKEDVEGVEAVKGPEVEVDIECSLPKKDLFRPDEVATYFDVSEQTIRLWCDHGKLISEKYGHRSMRITRQSIVNLRASSMMNR